MWRPTRSKAPTATEQHSPEVGRRPETPDGVVTCQAPPGEEAAACGARVTSRPSRKQGAQGRSSEPWLPLPGVGEGAGLTAWPVVSGGLGSMALRWKREGRAAEGPGGQEGACPSTGQPPAASTAPGSLSLCWRALACQTRTVLLRELTHRAPQLKPESRTSGTALGTRCTWPFPWATVPPPVSNQDKDLSLRPTQAAIGQATALHPQTKDRLKVSRQDRSCWTAHRQP